MSEHKLKTGISIIDGIKTIGLIMGYHVQLEQPVNMKKQNSPAVDLAWFKEENHKFPLFIFEVESSASNGMVYNPMKVFSKKNEKFEKPLFFFQLVLSSSHDSSRINDLKETYGTYNYRIYRIKTEESQHFLLDILEQHRRISQNLDVTQLIKFLLMSKWIEFDLPTLTNHIESLDFEKESGTLLSSYILLASQFQELIPIASEYLKKIHVDFYSNINKVLYNNYMGSNWCFPIHLGIIYASNDDLDAKHKAILQLKYWQNNDSHMTMIGPHFGLSQDYDEFIVWGAGGLFGILSSLFYDNLDMRFYFANQLKIIIDQTHPKYKIPNLLWLLHIIPPIKKVKYFSIMQSKFLKI
ncbi:hypothetical protein [Paludibacter sp.]|uniref:hypothetical protein n=1 Tax=Paludibacter sp. TaxID=1898105 RepID=UPI00135405F9|nr:hypothetical protein [Paludibacter sp.]MTK54028.1 hypothetical protein [Paludibacter sp.]